MIFDLLTPPQGSRGGGEAFFCGCTPHSCELHIKLGWIAFNGLGGDSITDGRTEAITISPSLF